MSEKPKKTIMLWIISILLIFVGIGSIASHMILVSGSVPLPDEEILYFESLTIIDHILAIIPKIIALSSGILLVLGRKLGSPLILLTLVANIFFLFYQASLENPMSTFSYESIMPALIITTALYVGAFLYTNTLVRVGILK